MKYHTFLVLLCLLIFTWNISKAQSDSTQIKNYIDINIGQIFIRDIKISYERKIINTLKLKFELGYKFPENTSVFKSKSFILFYLPIEYKVETWYYASIGFGIFLGEKKQTYISCDLFYKYNFYDRKYYIYATGSSSESYIEYKSKWKDIYGSKIILGRKFISEYGIYLDLYFGLGIRYKIITETIYGKGGAHDGPEDIINYPIPENNNYEIFLQTFHLGVKLGYAWYRGLEIKQ